MLPIKYACAAGLSDANQDSWRLPLCAPIAVLKRDEEPKRSGMAAGFALSHTTLPAEVHDQFVDGVTDAFGPSIAEQYGRTFGC